MMDVKFHYWGPRRMGGNAYQRRLHRRRYWEARGLPANYKQESVEMWIENPVATVETWGLLVTFSEVE